ncbi:MAG: c-type cytochrome domain-containing protein [Pirellulaceae bacterium]
MFRCTWGLTLCAVVLILALNPKAVAQEASSAAVSFQRDVEPILMQHCAGCHQTANPRGGYDMVDFAALLSGGESGDRAIVPGDSHSSNLMDLIVPADGVANAARQRYVVVRRD